MLINYNLAGMVFGTLTAIEPTTQRSGGHVVWRCQCTCNIENCPKEVFIRGESLRDGLTNSCQKHRFDSTIHPAIRGYYTDMRGNAHRRNIDFELTLHEFNEIIKQVCNYCGNDTDIRYVRSNKTRNGISYRLRANGIDRLDSRYAYTVDNCVACCKTCNFAKHELLPEQYIDHCRRVVEYNTR